MNPVVRRRRGGVGRQRHTRVHFFKLGHRDIVVHVPLMRRANDVRLIGGFSSDIDDGKALRQKRNAVVKSNGGDDFMLLRPLLLARDLNISLARAVLTQISSSALGR